TLKDLKETIEKLFNDVDDSKKVIFSTTHKAKGLERDRVFMLANTYRYGPGVTGEEANLFYVAVTRAKKELYMVRNPSKYQKFDDKKSRKEKSEINSFTLDNIDPAQSHCAYDDYTYQEV